MTQTYWINNLMKALLMNAPHLIRVFAVLSLVTLVGMLIYGLIVKEEKWYHLMPAGMITGVTVFTLYLGTLSFFLKGEVGIFFIFLLFLLTGVYVFKKKGFGLRISDKQNDLAIPLFLYVILFAFIFVKAGNAVFGGDAITYWGLSTSFANGNYPQVLPWQPNFLTVHHQGAFLFMGAVHALSFVDIRVVHFIFVSFMIFAGFAFLWSFFYKKTNKSLISLMPPILGYLVFGGVYLLLPKFLFAKNSILQLESPPVLQSAKNALGALTSFFDLYYLVPRTTALPILLLIFVILINKKSNLPEQLKLFVLSSFSVVVLSVDESVFAAMILPVVGLLLYRFKGKKNLLAYGKKLFFAGILFFILFWIVGNPMRDSILTPTPEASRFKIVGISEIIEQGRLGFLKSAVFDTPLEIPAVWYLPHLLILLAMALIFNVFLKKEFLWLMLLTSMGAMLLYFIVDHTFWPGNYPRFLLFSYQFWGFALGSIIVYLFRNRFKYKLLSLSLILLTLPSILVNINVVAKSVPSETYSNYGPITPKHKILDWVDSNLQYNSRVFFIDGFLKDKNYSEYTLHGIQGYGLFIPISSAEYKMHTAEFGTESIDIIRTLSPAAINKLGIEYIYILDGQVDNFSSSRIKEIRNEEYFPVVYKDDRGRLYKVTDNYIKNADEEETIVELSKKAGVGNKIFVDAIPNIDYYTRSGLFLALSDNVLFSEWGQGHYNYVERFIDVREPMYEINYDYVVVSENTDIGEVCDCGNLEEIWRLGEVVAYKNISN